MRQRAAESDVVIVNHHLLCADASVRKSAFGEVIPACATLVVDEAHQLEDVATQYFGVAVSNSRVDDLVRDGERLLATASFEPRQSEDIARALTRLVDIRTRLLHRALARARSEPDGSACPLHRGHTRRDLPTMVSRSWARSMVSKRLWRLCQRPSSDEPGASCRSRTRPSRPFSGVPVRSATTCDSCCAPTTPTSSTTSNRADDGSSCARRRSTCRASFARRCSIATGQWS